LSALAKIKDDFARFTRCDQPAKPRIIAGSCGEVGTRKTSFWLGAPGPIVVFSFDRGLEGVVEPYQVEKEIYVKEYDWATAPGCEPDQQMAIDIVAQFDEDFRHALTVARTVILDKETDLWSIAKYARFGPPEKGRPDDWEGLKAQIRVWLNAPKPLDINFGVIQAMKNEWVTKNNPKTGKDGITQTGVRIPAGMEEVEAIMHINIEHLHQDGEFLMKIGKARGPGGRDIQYQTIPAVSFGEFAQLVFPDSDEGDWV
jgi:hypothetical protein